MNFTDNKQLLSMYEAAIDGDEQYFDHWLTTMKKNGLSMTTIKSKIEKLDHEQYSILHYTIRYNHLNLSRKIIEEFHFDVNLVGRDGETPLHTVARYEILSRNSISNDHTKLITTSPSIEQNVIAYLVSCQADLSKTDYHGRTPLHHAAMRNNYNSAKQLIELGASINIFDGNNATPLHFASRFNSIDCVRLLIEHRAIIDQQDANGNTPLHCIALSQHILCNSSEELHFLQNTAAHFLLHRAEDYLQSYLEIENKERKTALSVACEYGNINLVRILLIYGASIRNYMPIHMAVRSGNVDIVQLLLQYQVPLTSTNIYAETPLHIACKFNRIDVLQILINYQNENFDLEVRDYQGYTPLLTASYFDHYDCIRMLLLNHANITAIDNHGKNILHICIERHCENALRHCLKWIQEDVRSCNMFIRGDRHGNTILHAAAKNGSFQTCDLLLDTLKQILLRTQQSHNNRNSFMNEYLSLILKKNIDKRTPVHETAKIGNIAMLQFFFCIIHDENQTDEYEQYKITLCEDYDDEFKTSLHLAAVEGHYKIVQLLIDQGANVWSCDMNNSTPLHEAAAHNRYRCVEILLAHHAPINQFDGKQNTPLHRASQYGHWKIVRLLLNYNADVRLTNSDGYNSLEVAILNNHQLTVHEFLNHETWTKSLRNAQLQTRLNSSSSKYENLSTPLRKLIRYMPNEADQVFTRSMIEIGGSEENSYKIIFNYEFLEDQFSIFKWKQDSPIHSIDAEQKKAKILNLLSVFKSRQQQEINMKQTSQLDSHVDTLRQNHPLYIIITYHQYDLLKHPLIDRLIERKWVQFSRTFFWILFLFYGFFLASFTSTILRVHHPQYYYSLFNASISTVSCETISLNLLRHESFILTKKNFYDTMIKWLLFSTILIHMIKNILLICIRFKMFFGLSNILELIALILSIIFSHDFYSWQMSIRFRCSFQWQCGAFGILIGWITLIIYVQFLSASGIYVVMLEVILRKFLRFIPILIIFILGFGLSFHMLLQNQNVYNHTFDALIRTILMLTGEFNYEEHLYRQENESNRYYYQIIFLLYLLFCILMTILMMNLLIANAVGEIPPLIERANVKSSIMRIKLIMDYEILLSTFEFFIPYLKKRVKLLIDKNQNEIIYPNKTHRYKHKYYHIKKFLSDRKKQSVLKANEEKIEQIIQENVSELYKK
ncbi:unnamed protein product [Rotaria magnacalcarata]|uniref:Transient receptor potential cation channel subfamily A member 1 n=5 Tax=Rotaria magnacalcarata TaxID=392030 RepID=A0A816R4Z4_9BILA|nr:unnamed protein product [Rotaria magnacalcarata]CAF3876269.1 unnamed protein product [Rotaria magnacalcarata]CAF3900044.1 unnamed protein product [Rotaria magnacalcarata]CAF3936064.1 unnamed protein product [Rotaria magnacalcarata]